MIVSFRDDETRRLYETGESRRFSSFLRAALRKLEMVAAATRVETLRVPPGNRLEAPGGNRKGQWSIRINDRRRIRFSWSAKGAENAEIVDCH